MKYVGLSTSVFKENVYVYKKRNLADRNLDKLLKITSINSYFDFFYSIWLYFGIFFLNFCMQLIGIYTVFLVAIAEGR